MHSRVIAPLAMTCGSRYSMVTCFFIDAPKHNYTTSTGAIIYVINPFTRTKFNVTSG